MRLLTLLLLLGPLLVVQAVGIGKPNVANCKGKPSPQKCDGPMDVGTGGTRRCRRSENNAMWYYNAALNKTCMPLSYKGCKGNGNRWCSKGDCEAKCRR